MGEIIRLPFALLSPVLSGCATNVPSSETKNHQHNQPMVIICPDGSGSPSGSCRWKSVHCSDQDRSFRPNIRTQARPTAFCILLLLCQSLHEILNVLAIHGHKSSVSDNPDSRSLSVAIAAKKLVPVRSCAIREFSCRII